MTSFSIVVCAYNAAARIGETLRYLALLRYPVNQFEIIVVDNNSNDATSDIALGTWRTLNSDFSFRIVVEEAQGLSNARKRGIFESKGEYIVFCDDDNWLGAEYLKHADETLAGRKDIGVLGGQGIPVTDADAFPNWFYTYANDFGVGVQAMQSGDISGRGYVWGAASIIRRKPLIDSFLGGCEFLLSGRKGSSLASGDDSELCKWFLIAGYRLWYDERLTFRHFIPRQRLTLDYLARLNHGIKESTRILAEYDQWLQRAHARARFNTFPVRWIMSEIRYKIRSTAERPVVKALASKLDRANSPRPAYLDVR